MASPGPKPGDRGHLRKLRKLALKPLDKSSDICYNHRTFTKNAKLTTDLNQEVRHNSIG